MVFEKSGKPPVETMTVEDSIHILLVEDDPDDVLLLKEALAESSAQTCRVSQAGRLDAGLDLLAKGGIDVVVLDLNLPDSRGLDTLETLLGRVPGVPVVVMSGIADEALAAKAVEKGAQDYLVKGKDDRHALARVLRYAIERHRSVRNLQISETRTRAIIENDSNGILIVDSGGVVRFANLAAEVIFGRPQSELVGREFGFPIAVGKSQELEILQPGGSPRTVEMGTTELGWDGRPASLVSLRDITGRKQMERSNRLMAEWQQQLTSQDNVEKICQLVGEKIKALVGDGYVAITMLNEKTQSLKISGLYGFGALYDQLAHRFKLDPAKWDYSIQDMTVDELRIFRSGNLEKVEGGLYAMLTRKVPKTICDLAEEQLKISGVYTMGFIGQGIHFGGLTLFAKQDIAPYKEMIEAIMNQAALSINRLRAENALRESNAFSDLLLKTIPLAMDIVDSAGRVLFLNPEMEKAVGKNKVGQYCWDLYKDDKHQCDECPLKREITLGETAVIETAGVMGKKVYEINHTGMIYKGERAVLEVFYDITERKRVEEDTHLRLAELEVLYASSLSFGGSLQPREIAEKVLDTLSERLHWHHAAIRMYHPENESIELLAFTQPVVENKAERIATEKHLQALIRRPGEGISGWVIQHGESVFSGDLTKDSRYIEIWPENRSGMYIPLKTGDRTFGCMSIESEQANAFTETDEWLLTTLAAQAAGAIENARLFEETNRRLKQVQILHAIDTAINSSLDLRITFEVFLDQVVHQLGVDAADVLMFNPETKMLECVGRHGFRTDALQYTHLRLGESYAGVAAVERKTLHIPDVRVRKTDFLRSPKFISEGFITCFFVPLIAKSQLKGVLEIYLRSAFEANQEWLEFLQTLAGQAAIAIDNATLFGNMQKANFELAVAYDATIDGWSKALDLRDHETEGHTQRVSEMTRQLACAMGISETEQVHIRRGALLHDIGKMGVPDGILRKPGKLTPEEWQVMRQHPQFAYDMIAPIAYLRPALDIPYCHHEKWDGTGYPRGLKGEEIPLTARIFTLVDVFDALTSDRPYRKAWSRDEALTYIREQAGLYFDPKVTAVFLEVEGMADVH
jgi:PAS domain S-box-containing protein